MRKAFVLTMAVSSVVLLGGNVFAQFSPGPNPINATVNGQQTLAGGIGAVTATGTISHNGTGGGGSAVVITGSSTINNSGIIENTSTSRAIRTTIGGLALILNNSGTIRAASDDAFQVSADTAVSVINDGTIESNGAARALNFNAITSAANSVVNNATGILRSNAGGDAIRPGVNGTITNAGQIIAIPVAGSGSDGVDAQTNSGVIVTNTGTISGRNGVTGGNTVFAITIHNDAGTMTGINGSGVNIDGLFATTTATVTNAAGAIIKGTVDSTSADGDGDGVDVDGVVDLNNFGDVLGYGAKGVDSGGLPNNSDGVAAGGGTIVNRATGRIIGSTLLADAPNTDLTRNGNGILVDDGSNGPGVALTNVTNFGLIQGKTGLGIKFVGTFNDTITNNATGIIRGLRGTVIQTGAGNDIVTSAGTIAYDGVGTGTAVALEDGNDSLTFTGGTVAGDLNGGTGTDALKFDVGAANTFHYAGTAAEFETTQVTSGKLSAGASGAAGAITIANGTLEVDGGLHFDLDGATPGVAGGYDQIGLSSGGVTLDPASTLTIDPTFLPSNGFEFVLLNLLDPSTSVSGQFAGLPNNSIFTAGGQAFAIHYAGGTGNDLTITAVLPEPTTMSLFGFAACAALYRRKRR